LSYVWPLRRLISLVQRMLFQKALDRLGWHKELCGFVINNFQLASLVKRSDAAFVLYDYIDNVFGFTRLPKHVVAQWRETIRTADLITVTSATLARQLEPHRARDVHIVGNGVEFTFFSEGRELLPPQDLPTGKPIVGYTGAVYPWLDFELLYSVCSPLKSFNFVFIGPIHPEVSTQVRSLSRLENVRFLGFRPYETIPGYVRSFDAGIIPFRKNELTAAVNPVKLYEYCAAGKPTVATAFSQDILQFKDKIFIADSTEDFLAALRKAIEKSRDPSFVACLQEFAYEHRWETKTTLILQLIQHHLKANHPS
jgi:glycosyltransferase involved in cell wall biosynthesis